MKFVTIIVIISIVIAASLLYTSVILGTINIKAVFMITNKEDQMSPNNIELDLGVISSPSGSKLFSNVAKLNLSNDTYIRVVPVIKEASKTGNVSLTLSAIIYLNNKEKNYSIFIPCLYSTRECARIMIVLPGYDAPLRVEKGEYNVSVEIRWIARGNGTIDLLLSMQIVETDFWKVTTQGSS